MATTDETARRSPLHWSAGALACVVGTAALAIAALSRGETVNAVWLVIAAVCSYLIAYRFYSLFIANSVLQVDPARPTPAVRRNDGLDYLPTAPSLAYNPTPGSRRGARRRWSAAAP
jgi:carbon starvation protein